MDLYIFCVVLGAAGMAAMALLGFASSHSGGHGHDTAGHEAHGLGTPHVHAVATPHPVAHAPSHTIEYIGGKPHTITHVPVAHGHGHANVELHGAEAWKAMAWSWLSPRVMFNFLVGFGATGLVIERLIGPALALPVAIIGGISFEKFVVRPIFNSLFRFESQPAQTLESAIMSEARAVTGFDSRGNGLIALELGGEVVQILGTLTPKERTAGVRVRAGDSVRIEEVDGTRNRCTVSRIGLAES
jgi:translation initiation factor IF-1